MANAGEHTNKRQFFLTFKSCEHLNRKHSVFGSVVAGLEEVVMKMEKVPTDTKNRPLEPITILDTIVVENPFQEAEAWEMKRIESKQQQQKAESQPSASSGNAKKTPVGESKASSPGLSIGRYLKKSVASLPSATTDNDGIPILQNVAKPKPVSKTGKSKLTNFSGW